MSPNAPAEAAAFGDWLSRQRKLRDLTQEELARLVGCARITVRKIEAGDARPSKQMAERLAEVLEIPAAERESFVSLARSGRALAERESVPLPARSARSSRLNNLPKPPTAFVGRSDELERLAKLIAQPATRLISIVGPGGMGKTRLALEIAARLLPAFAHGVYFVDLAPLSSPDSILPAVAEAVGFVSYAGGEPQPQLFAYLRDQQMLLVLDNFEQLLNERAGVDGARLVSSLLADTARLQLLVTSRERLQLQEEQVFSVEGLDFPAANVTADAARYDSVKLFVQSAQRLQPGFAPDKTDLKYLARICGLAQGMPLGIELSAAWVEMLSLAEIANEMARNTDLLQTGLRNVPERQRSIRAVFDSAWSFLAEPERDVFKKLSIFRSGFTREAAQSVCGATLRGLSTLVNKSLLAYRASGRYETHELLRQYAAEQLQQSPALQAAVLERHSAYYLNWLSQKDAALKDRRLQVTLSEMDGELENARAAWEYSAAAGEDEPLAQAIDALMRYCQRRGRMGEGESLCQLLTTHATTATQTLAQCKALAWQGVFAIALGRLTDAHEALQRSLDGLALLTTDAEAVSAACAFSLQHLGTADRYLGDFEAVRRHHTESLALARQLNNSWIIARVLNEMAVQGFVMANYDEAQQYADESLRLHRMIGEPISLAEVLSTCGHIAEPQGLLVEAEAYFSSSLSMHRELNDLVGVARLLLELGSALRTAGRFGEAKLLIAEGLEMFVELGLRRAEALCRVNLANACLTLGEYAQAQSESEQALLLTAGLNYRTAYAQALSNMGSLCLVRGQTAMAHNYFEQSVQFFRQIKLREKLAIDLVFESASLRLLGQAGAASSYLSEALRMALDRRIDFARSLALAEAAVRLAEKGQVEHAIALHTMVRQHTPLMRAQHIEDVWGRTIEAAAASRPPEVVATAEARGQALTLTEAIALATTD